MSFGPRTTRKWFEEIKTQLSQSNLKDFRLLTQYCKPSTEIVEMASESKADLILMGGYRHRVLLEWLTGSTVDAVLRNTPLSVLIV
ncbi:MAG: universal stress protein [Candidatus Aminicenantes bacterium]|nr:MAG: universal stress protein [Candidatus Aminicenantes bacterium]